MLIKYCNFNTTRQNRGSRMTLIRRCGNVVANGVVENPIATFDTLRCVAGCIVAAFRNVVLIHTHIHMHIYIYIYIYIYILYRCRLGALDFSQLRPIITAHFNEKHPKKKCSI